MCFGVSVHAILGESFLIIYGLQALLIIKLMKKLIFIVKLYYKFLLSNGLNYHLPTPNTHIFVQPTSIKLSSFQNTKTTNTPQALRLLLAVIYCILIFLYLALYSIMNRLILRSFFAKNKLQTIKRVLICPDKFKFSLTAEEIARNIQECIPPHIQSKIVLLADGGQGSLEAISNRLPGKIIKCKVHNPRFNKIEAQYFCTTNNEAYIEMARASGLALLSKQQRNPLLTTTLGTGQMILDSLMRGNKKINLLVGGSATNQGGIGCAQALGYSFQDQSENKLLPIGESLKKIVKIKAPEDRQLQLIRGAEINVYTDVKNPLTGINGASYVYALQKGGDQKSIKLLDEGLENMNRLFKKQFNIDANRVAGSGAAGGLGAGCLVFLNSKLLRGIDLIFEITNFDAQLEWADLVITGQGKFDSQTLQGKVVKGVIDRCAQYKKPVVVLCAILDKNQLEYSTQKGVEVLQLLNGPQKAKIQANVTAAKLKEKLRAYFSNIQSFQ